MGLRGRSVVLLVTAAFLAGGTAGVLAGRLLDPSERPSAPLASTRVDAVAQPLPIGPSSGPESPSSPPAPRPLPSPPDADAPDPAQPRDPEPEALGSATLVVTFASSASSGPTDGAVYVLPAGAPGVDDPFTVPHGALGEPLRVPAPATYDVGIRAVGGEHDGDVVLATDVRVVPGETRRLEIPRSPAVRKPIRMRVSPGPTGPLPAGWVVRVRWSPVSPELREYPGRGEPREGRLPVTARFAVRGDADVETEPLPEGGAWTAEAFVEVEDVRDPPAERLETPLRAVVAPSAVRPGERVEVRLERVTLLRLHAEAPQGGWPEGVGPLRLVWSGEGPPSSVEYTTPWPLEQGEQLEVSVGKGRLSWSGPGLVSGQSETIRATPPGEGIVLLEPRIELDPARRPAASRLFLRVRTGERPIDVEEPASVYLLRSAEGRFPAAWVDVDRSWASDLRIDLPPASVDEVHRILVVHRDRSSALVDVRGGADVQVDMHPGGYVVLVPASDEAPAFETALERADGGPLLTVRVETTGVSRTVASAVPVSPGLVLGPFVEGPLRLRVVRAGLHVADLSPTIRAGAYVPLRIPR